MRTSQEIAKEINAQHFRVLEELGRELINSELPLGGTFGDRIALTRLEPVKPAVLSHEIVLDGRPRARAVTTFEGLTFRTDGTAL